MIPNGTPFKLLLEGDIWPKELHVNADDNNDSILGSYGIFLVAAMYKIVGAQTSGSQLVAAASWTVMIEQDEVTKLICGQFRVDGFLASGLADCDTNEGVSSEGL